MDQFCHLCFDGTRSDRVRSDSLVAILDCLLLSQMHYSRLARTVGDPQRACPYTRDTCDIYNTSFCSQQRRKTRLTTKKSTVQIGFHHGGPIFKSYPFRWFKNSDTCIVDQ